MARTKLGPPTVSDAEGEPFRDAAEAWFWCVRGAIARLDGAFIRAGLAEPPRPCEPLDVLQSVERLYRRRVLTAEHLRVLVHYGRRYTAPDSTWRLEQRAARLWDDALDRLAPVLRRKGIVA